MQCEGALRQPQRLEQTIAPQPPVQHLPYFVLHAENQHLVTDNNDLVCQLQGAGEPETVKLFKVVMQALVKCCCQGFVLLLDLCPESLPCPFLPDALFHCDASCMR